jgi:hypothetical protein
VEQRLVHEEGQELWKERQRVKKKQRWETVVVTLGDMREEKVPFYIIAMPPAAFCFVVFQAN